jgi:uncharacterized protein (TIGR00251 family)
MLNLRETPSGLAISVQLTPRSSRNKILKIHDGALKIAIQAPPVDGAANDELIRFLAKTFSLPKSNIQITSGHTGKRKVLALNGITKAQFSEILAELRIGE